MEYVPSSRTAMEQNVRTKKCPATKGYQSSYQCSSNFGTSGRADCLFLLLLITRMMNRISQSVLFKQSQRQQVHHCTDSCGFEFAFGSQHAQRYGVRMELKVMKGSLWQILSKGRCQGLNCEGAHRNRVCLSELCVIFLGPSNNFV